MTETLKPADEPTYIYRKGEGWVVSTTPEGPLQATRRHDDYEVTVFDRLPEVGEQGWWCEPQWTLAQCLDDILNEGGPAPYGWKVDRSDLLEEAAERECPSPDPRSVLRTVVTRIHPL